MTEGIVSVLKPPAMSSSNVVSEVRHLFHEKRVGHLGTLDPGAAGVLPVCVGRAVRLFDYLVDKEKTYRFEILFGQATETQDIFGKVTETSQKKVGEGELLSILPDFRGEIIQQAPAYSALKSGGRKLYDLALAGEEIPEKLRPVTISRLELLDKVGENGYLMEVTCSRGTYVRTLCHDLGRAAGSCACMGMLLRTASGPFAIEKSFTLEELHMRREAGTLEETLVSCEEALQGMPRVDLTAQRYVPTQNGLPTRTFCGIEGNVRMYCGGVFMGIGEVKNGEVRLKVHLYEERRENKE